MPWDERTGEERVDPQGLRKPVKPRPGYQGVFKGPMPAPSLTPPSTYQRPGGGQFGLGQVGGGAPGLKPAPGVGFDPGIPRMPPVPGEPTTGPTYDDYVRSGGGFLPPSMRTTGSSVPLAQTPLMGQGPAASAPAMPLGGMRRGGADPREALLRQLMLG